MKQSYSEFIEDQVITSLVTVALGILLALLHSVAITVVCVILGIFAIILGVSFGIKYLRAPETHSKYNLLIGLMLVAIGLFVVIKPASLENFVAVIFGIIILFHGITACVDTVRLYKRRYKFWFVSLIFAVLTLLAGILLIILQKQLLDSLTLLLGIALILEGLMGLWIALKVKKING